MAQQALSNEELKQVFTGKKVQWGNYGEAEYHSDGTYQYTSWERAGHPVSLGKWEPKDGQLCETFSAGATRCDKIVKETDGYYLVPARGPRSLGKFK